MRPEGSITSYTMMQDAITVGRSDENQIVLDDGKVSSQHMRIERRGNQYVVTDLNSTNGTYLGQQQLLPGIPEAWGNNQPLRVGQHYLRVIPDGQHTLIGTVAPTSDSSEHGASASVLLYVETPTIKVVPGQQIVVPFVLVNQSDIVGHFGFEVDGLAAEWLRLPQPVELMPNAQQELSLTIQPPRSATSLAKTYAVELRTVGQGGPNVQASRRLYSNQNESRSFVRYRLE